MATDTYVKLQAAIASELNRTDLASSVTAFSPATLDTDIVRLIEKAENRIERDLNARGGHKAMETVTNSLTTTGSQETLTLPTDFLSARVFALTSSPYVILEFVDPNSLFTQYPSTTSGQPEKYTIIGTNTAYLRPIPDGVYTTRLIYTAKLPRLSSTQTTNWLLTSHVDIYISATMVEACLFLENDERTQYWQGSYDQRMNDLMGDDRMTRWAAVPSKPSLQVTIA